MVTRLCQSRAVMPAESRRDSDRRVVVPTRATVACRVALGLILASGFGSVSARDSLGVAVDNTCSAFNGTRPYAASGEAPARCSLCHGPNLSLRNPEWAWTMGGSSGQRNFCVVQGIISLPSAAHTPPDLVITPGNTIDLVARGFSPTGGAGAVSFVWRFSDRTTTLTGPTHAGIPMPDTGTVTITLETRDAAGADDQTPEQRTVLVTGTPFTARPDHYSTRPGHTLTVAPLGVLSNDSGSGPLSATLVRDVSHGTLALNSDGSFEYRARKSFIGVDSFEYAIGSDSAVTPTTVTISVGSCKDGDKDGYSGEGGSCGPKDCADTERTIHPGATESCGDAVDNDCNGLIDASDPACGAQDCLGSLLADQVSIASAKWALRTRALSAAGGGAPAGAHVTIADAKTGKSLGNTLVDEAGQWSFQREGMKKAPCRIQVEIAGRSGESAVENAPASCGPLGAPLSCPAGD